MKEEASSNAIPRLGTIDSICVSGELLSQLDEEKLTTLLAGLGALGLDVEVNNSPESAQDNPLSRECFRDFATSNGLTQRRADKAWMVVGFAAATSHRTPNLPKIDYIDEPENKLISSQSLRARLIATGPNTAAWPRASESVLSFLLSVALGDIGGRPNG